MQPQRAVLGRPIFWASSQSHKTAAAGWSVQGPGCSLTRGLKSSSPSWRQQRTSDGVGEHFGFSIQPTVQGGDTGVGRIENDSLCEQWVDSSKDLEICVVVFRVPERDARIRWGDYVMVTETGPQPFKLVE